MAAKRTRDGDGKPEILERGDIYFVYRPKVEDRHPEGIEDVERFYMVLKPEHGRKLRLAIIGRKRLPDIEDHERNWGFIEKIAKSAKQAEAEFQEVDYQTKTRGERHRPAARPAGEGVYAFVQAGRNMHLVYDLELPEKRGPVQRELNIAPQASFGISIKNPEKGSPKAAGLREGEQADYPKSRQKAFAGRRFAPTDPKLLDYEGAEFVLVGARGNPEASYDVDLDTEHESLDTAEIVKELHMGKPRHPVEPLLKGQWR